MPLEPKWRERRYGWEVSNDKLTGLIALMILPACGTAWAGDDPFWTNGRDILKGSTPPLWFWRRRDVNAVTISSTPGRTMSATGAFRQMPPHGRRDRALPESELLGARRRHFLQSLFKT